MPDRHGRRAAAGGVTDAVDPDGTEGSHYPIFRSVRADRKDHFFRRTIADRHRHGGDDEPKGRHGGAGAVLRGRPRAARKSALATDEIRLIFNSAKGVLPPCGGGNRSAERSIQRSSRFSARENDRKVAQCRKWRTPVNTMAMP